MTLPASGPISLSDIRNEFGGSAPDSLSEYYRGGAYVPNIPANNSIPTSGAISLSDFYGTTNLLISLSGGGDTTIVPGGTATASISFVGDGNYIGDSGSDWGVPNTSGLGNDYQIRATLSSGSAPSSGTLNTWQNIGTSRTWSLTATNFDATSTLSISIRDVATLTVITTNTYVLSAFGSP